MSFALPSAIDLVDANPTVVADESSGFFPVGTTFVTVTATDATGNSSQVSFSITVTDVPEWDYGDAPDPLGSAAGRYPTLKGSGGRATSSAACSWEPRLMSMTMASPIRPPWGTMRMRTEMMKTV